MGSALADYGCETWLAALFGITAIPSGYWVALCSDEPGDEDDGDTIVDIEPDPAGGYARIWYPAGAANWAPEGAFVTNLNPVDFGIPTAEWGPVNHFVLGNDATSGDLYGWGELVSPLEVLPGAPVTIPAGGLIVTMSGLVDSIAI